jgi:hypothetical protein
MLLKSTLLDFLLILLFKDINKEVIMDLEIVIAEND